MDRTSPYALIVLTLCVVTGAAWAGVLDELERLTGQSSSAGEREFLPADEAFVMTHEIARDGRLTIAWEIEPGYYLYRNKMKVRPQTAGLVLAGPALPAGEMKDDPGFGPVAIFRNHVAVSVPVEHWPVGEFLLKAEVGYQGCAEDGICYPPLKKTVAFSPNQDEMSNTGLEPSRGFSESDRIANDLAVRSLPAMIATFLGLGVLLAFTPCVFPMVPILSGIIVGQKQPVNTRRAFTLSSTYVLAMAVTYAAAGVAAGVLGRNLQAAFQQPAVIIGFSLIFVLLALSMFGFYEIKVPSRLQNRLDALSRSQRGGTYAGVAVMGILSAVIVGPCVAPPLAGILVYIGQTGSAVVGGSALFALGLGMGLPLIVLGTSTGAVLPVAGAWMEFVKKIFGVIFLGMAIWFLERILPGRATLALWALLFVGSSLFLGALDAVDSSAGGWRRLRKGMGLAMLFYGAVLIVGASAGGEDLAFPLAPLVGGGAEERAAVKFIEVKGIESVEVQLQRASRVGRAVMLDFYADWCVECKILERRTFTDANVAARLGELVLLRADVTDNDAADQALLSRYELFGPPAVLFFKNGRELRSNRLVGFADAEEFTAYLDRL